MSHPDIPPQFQRRSNFNGFRSYAAGSTSGDASALPVFAIPVSPGSDFTRRDFPGADSVKLPPRFSFAAAQAISPILPGSPAAFLPQFLRRRLPRIRFRQPPRFAASGHRPCRRPQLSPSLSAAFHAARSFLPSSLRRLASFIPVLPGANMSGARPSASLSLSALASCPDFFSLSLPPQFFPLHSS